MSLSRPLEPDDDGEEVDTTQTSHITSSDEDCMHDDDESHIDMEAMMAEINEKDPNVTSIMTFTKDKITFRSSVDDSNEDMSDSSTSIDSKHQSVEAGDIPSDTTLTGGDKSRESVHHHAHHDGSPCECKESKHVLPEEQEVQAILAAEYDWVEAMSHFQDSYHDNPFGLKGSDKLNLAQS